MEGSILSFVPVGCPHPAPAAPKPLQRVTLHTCQVLQLEEPVLGLEGLASAPDRHRSHLSKYDPEPEGPLGERASARLGQAGRMNYLWDFTLDSYKALSYPVTW